MKINVQLTTKYTIALSVLFSCITPTFGAWSLPKKSCTPKEALTTAAILSGLAAVFRLFTKKTTPTAQLPADDSFYEWVKYVVDEKLIGMIGKGERVDSFDFVTGKFNYKKLEARGLMGILATNGKEQWLPALLVVLALSKCKNDLFSAYQTLRNNSWICLNFWPTWDEPAKE